MQKTLEELCADLLAAKEEESAANERRVAVERDIIALTGLPDEGSKTVDAGRCKVRVEQRVDRKVDEKAWALIKDEVPEPIQPFTVKTELKVDKKGLDWLKDNEPGFWKLVCSVITEKPMKPSVKVEVGL